MKNKIKNNVLLTLFGILYTSIAFVSLFHAIAFFEPTMDSNHTSYIVRDWTSNSPLLTTN